MDSSVITVPGRDFICESTLLYSTVSSRNSVVCVVAGAVFDELGVIVRLPVRARGHVPKESGAHPLPMQWVPLAFAA